MVDFEQLLGPNGTSNRISEKRIRSLRSKTSCRWLSRIMHARTPSSFSCKSEHLMDGKEIHFLISSVNGTGAAC